MEHAESTPATRGQESLRHTNQAGAASGGQCPLLEASFCTRRQALGYLQALRLPAGGEST